MFLSKQLFSNRHILPTIYIKVDGVLAHNAVSMETRSVLQGYQCSQIYRFKYEYLITIFMDR